MPAAKPRHSPEELARLGAEILDQRVRPALRPEDDGKFVAIDVTTGDFEIDEEDYAADARLRSRIPAADVWLARAGHPTAYQIGLRVPPQPRSPDRRIQLTVKRYEYWIAIVTLAGTLVTAIVGLLTANAGLREQSNQRQQITDLEDMIRGVVQRPCEGEWSCSIVFTRFHGNTTKKFRGSGRAVVVWRPSEQLYEVFVWMSVTVEGKPGEQLVTAVSKGTIKGDRSGRPIATTMPLEYLARTGLPPYDDVPFGTLEYTDLEFHSSSDGRRIEKIGGKYHSSKSDATVVFQR